MFFALWPDDAVRAGLYQCAQVLHQDCGGRLIRPNKLHQTLVFLGNVATDRISRLTALAAELQLAAFLLEFCVTGYWRHNRIVWAAPHATPEPLHALVAALEQCLRKEGFRFDQRPYASHVTLIRNARPPTTLPTLQLAWLVSDFVLVQSSQGATGSEYDMIARWPAASRPT